ncbi:hypothetical protein [Fodinibius halophilus]|uniref:Collagen-like protein n=1 Tax=Fodinibius halophilus TaxID=1736908 RepID=A0A6M1SUI1_9BACT|nr:hypothetical protein [Fodinibius halophilus]NGP87216.1 hypothetical protein [Fodinibius halophilus]
MNYFNSSQLRISNFFIGMMIFCSVLTAFSFVTGCEGPAGAEGPKGEEGQVGPAGEDGSEMYAGQGAPASDLGSNGDYYLDKNTGEIYGPQTDTGWGTPLMLRGEDGKDGSEIHAGSGSPADTLGKIGDYYLDRSSAKLYGPKTDSGWISFVFLKGPKGDPGEDGNANVISSGWTQIPAGDWMQSGAYESPNDISTYPISAASGGWFGLSSVDQLNGAVFVYVRGLGKQSGGRDSDVMQLPASAKVSGGGQSGGIELRFTHGGDPNYAMWIVPNVGLQSGAWDTSYMMNTYLPDLEFKAVVIPATTYESNGIPPLDFSNYEAVVGYYNLDR